VPARKGRGEKAKADPNMLALEKRLSDAMGLKVTVDHRDAGGTVHIHYRNLEQFDEIVRRIAGKSG
jgi:ParB family transcriptional regulator, chromosome partitioning protein